MDDNELLCPYCGAVQYETGEDTESAYRKQRTCEHCGKLFWYAVRIVKEYAVYEE